MRPWIFIAEDELVPYTAHAALPPAGLVVLAPHPDDEVFGCGGTVALACDQQCPVSIVVATDGGKGGDPVAREAESRCAVRVLAGSGRQPEIDFWRCADRELVPDGALVSRIRSLVLRRQPQWVLAPSPFEIHPDHRALCLAAIEAMQTLPVDLGFYEIGQPLMAGRFVDITAVMSRKRAAMACFTSQLATQRYDEQVEGLNRLRAYTLGPAVSHAEAFWFPAPGAGPSAQRVVAAATLRLQRHLGLGIDSA